MTADYNEAHWKLATERAEKIAPQPKSTSSATWMGGIVTTMVVTLFMGLAGITQEQHRFAWCVTVATGFLVPFLYCKYLERRHYKELLKEYRELQARGAINAPRP
jgi:hypothetical protein